MSNSSNSILILGINFSPELTGIGKYTGEMAEWLSLNGFQCTVITSFPYYPNWKVQSQYKSWKYMKEVHSNGNLLVYRCPFYVPKHPSGIKRILHEASFFFSSSLIVLRLLFKPRIKHIFCIAPPFHIGFLALAYRLFKGGKINYHIQDMQIEAARDLKMVKSERIFNVLFALEKTILNRVDSISSISEGMVLKIKGKSGREVRMFPNWVDTGLLFPIQDNKSLKEMWGYQASDRVVLYSGSIGEKQGLDVLIDIAIKCKAFESIKFIICGTGPYKLKLQELSILKGADNIRFLPLQEHQVFNQFLNMADVHLIIQKSGAADLVMPSKLTGILSIGGLVIATAQKGTSLYHVIDTHQMGLLIPPENEQLLFEAIVKACGSDFSIERRNARNYAEKYLDRNAILNSMILEILSD